MQRVTTSEILSLDFISEARTEPRKEAGISNLIVVLLALRQNRLMNFQFRLLRYPELNLELFQVDYK